MSDRIKQRVVLYTDGACLGNPGAGGWAFVLLHEASGRTKEGSGGEAGTTNNRMELLAVVMGLEALKFPCALDIVSDSKYVISGLEARGSYAAFGYQKSASSKKMIANVDLWRRLNAAAKGHEVTGRWTRGHVGNSMNERCDWLAMEAARAVTASGTA